MGKITFVPVGGLANRMRAVASAVALAAKSDSDLSIVWFQDWALNAPFSQLFKPVDRKIACLRDASQLDYALLDRPRSRNFHFRFCFRNCFSSLACTSVLLLLYVIGILILNGGLKKVAVFIWHHIPLFNLMIMYGSVGYLFR